MGKVTVGISRLLDNLMEVQTFIGRPVNAGQMSQNLCLMSLKSLGLQKDFDQEVGKHNQGLHVEFR